MIKLVAIVSISFDGELHHLQEQLNYKRYWLHFKLLKKSCRRILYSQKPMLSNLHYSSKSWY